MKSYTKGFHTLEVEIWNTGLDLMSKTQPQF